MKKYFVFTVISFVAVVTIFIGAWLDGRLDDVLYPKDDYSDSRSHLESMAEGIKDIPTFMGGWKEDTGTRRIKMEDLIAREAGARQSLTRAYKSPNSAKPVAINIICGLVRKVAIHTPDASYRGAGFKIVGEIQTVDFPYLEKRGTFYTALFTRELPEGGVERQRVFWGWKGVDTGWIAPEFPRQRWRPTDPILKLYLSTTEAEGDVLEENPAFEFAKVLLPELDTLLSGDYVPWAQDF